MPTCGWIVREVGRQPWAVYGLLRTEQAVSHLPVPAAATSLLVFVAIYTLLLALFLLFARRIVMNAPNINQQLSLHYPRSYDLARGRLINKNTGIHALCRGWIIAINADL